MVGSQEVIMKSQFTRHAEMQDVRIKGAHAAADRSSAAIEMVGAHMKDQIVALQEIIGTQDVLLLNIC